MTMKIAGYMTMMAENSRNNAKILREQSASAQDGDVAPELPDITQDAEEESAPQEQESPEEGGEEAAAGEGEATGEEGNAEGGGTGDSEGQEQQDVSDPLASAIVGYLSLLEKGGTEKEELVEYIESIDFATIPNAGPAARAFVDQNLSSLSLLDETVVVDIRKQLKRAETPEDLVAQLEEMLDRYPEMNEAMQRLVASGPDKSNLFRQLVAALCTGAIVPSNVGGEVHIPRKKNADAPLFILRPICTLGWGYVDLGPVSLTARSPEEYLSDSERIKLSNGAPEERRVLRNRVFVESVTDQLGGGLYVILSISMTDPKWEIVSWTSDIFRESYQSGDLEVIESSPGPDGELAVGEDGAWVTMVPWQVAVVGDEQQLAPITNEVRRDKTIVAQMFGNRFVWIGTGKDLGAFGANAGERVVKIDDEEKSKQIRRNVPDARERLLGRR